MEIEFEKGLIERILEIKLNSPTNLRARYFSLRISTAMEIVKLRNRVQLVLQLVKLL